MGSEWREISLGDVATLRNGAGVKQKFFSEQGIPLARVSDFTQDSIDTSASKFVEYEHAKKWESHLLCKGDVVVATVGSWPPNWSSVVGKVVRVPESAVGAIQNQNTCCILPNSHQLDKKFIFYRLKQEDFAWHAANSAGGSANQARLPVKKLGSFVFSLPSLPQQKSIAHILGTLDDKIELNRQINTTLEAMAQALFKSWFVDFDPVIDNALAAGNPIPPELAARAERRQQYHARANTSSDAQTTPYQPLPAAIQQQFPDRFAFTEAMGWVPEGWSIKRAEDIASVSIGKTPPRKEQGWFSEERDGNVVWVSIRDMGNANAFIGDSAEYLTPESIRKFNVKKVPKNSVLLSFKLTLGRVSIAQCEMTTNEAIAHFVNPKFGISREFLYCYLITFDYGRLGSTSSIATAVNSKLIKALPVLVPSHKVLDEFSSIVAAWFDQISQINMETNTLVALRNSLLPKLLSGQLRIPDAEAAVDKALAEA